MSEVLRQAMAWHQSGQLAAALAAYDRVLAAAPGEALAWRGRGLALAELGDMAAALAAFEALLALRPGDDEARALRDLAAAELPDDRLALGLDHAAAGRFADALAAFEALLAAQPGHAPAAINRAMVLLDMGRGDAALAAFDGALAAGVGDPMLVARVHYGRGLALQGHDSAAALAAFGAAHAAAPGDPAYAAALANLAVRHGEPGRAAAAFGVVLAAGADAGVFNDRGVARLALGDPTAALADFDAALAIDPRHARAAANRGEALRELGRMAEAHAALVMARSLAPEPPATALQRRHLAMHLADWDGLADDLAGLAGLETADPPVAPFPLLALVDDPALHRRLAERWLAARPAVTPLPALPARPIPADAVLRVGWLSADFHDHATMHLALAVLEAHDRARITVTALSHGPDTGDGWRARVGRAAQLIDVRTTSDADVAALVRSRGIDVLIDLKGLTGNPRPGILAARPAPVQAQWLGYPGTLPGVDYMIADHVVVPPATRAHIAEAIAFLPHTYQPNDRLAATLAAPVPPRDALGLPPGGMVFACFNQAYKILPAVFARWLTILAAVPDACLWLWVEAPLARQRLRDLAQAAGIDPARLVFAGLVPRAAHLARLSHAGLFLDTAPYGAHTSASDALRMGVPVLTLPGRSFASRVAASLLTTLGLPELIADDADAYVALAVALGRDPDRRADLRARLAVAAATAPLFDPVRFAMGLERACRAMAARAAAGLPPADIDVPAD